MHNIDEDARVRTSWLHIMISMKFRIERGPPTLSHKHLSEFGEKRKNKRCFCLAQNPQHSNDDDHVPHSFCMPIVRKKKYRCELFPSTNQNPWGMHTAKTNNILYIWMFELPHHKKNGAIYFFIVNILSYIKSRSTLQEFLFFGNKNIQSFF